MRKRKSQREYNQEIRDFIEYNKNQPIWESNKQKQEYIMEEIKELEHLSNEELTQFDYYRYKILLKFIQLIYNLPMSHNIPHTQASKERIRQGANRWRLDKQECK